MWWLAAAGLIMSALGSLSQARSNKKSLEASAEMAEYDAAIALQRAKQITDVYGQREAAVRRGTAISRGTRHAAIAQSGTGFGGSNADVDFQSEVFAELDALNVRYEGQIEAFNLRQHANRERMRANALREGAEGVMPAAYLGTAGSILSGTADISRMYRYGSTPSSMAGSGLRPNSSMYGNSLSSNIG